MNQTRHKPYSPAVWVRAARLHHWVKNLLVFVPLITSHRYGDSAAVSDALIAFFCFGMAASGVYILNDLVDAGDDRLHPEKRHRPFAAGQLARHHGLLAAAVLIAASGGLAYRFLTVEFVALIGLYYVLSIAYSLQLKKRAILDVVTLSGVHTLRIVGGAVAIAVPLSFWLLAFAIFIFLSLALAKRHAEIFGVRNGGEMRRIRGRGYSPGDLPMIAALGAASGYLSVLVLALYIHDAGATHYRNPEYIWLACILLLVWISRVWMLAHRGKLDEDPVIFAVRDRQSLLIGALSALVFWMAL